MVEPHDIILERINRLSQAIADLQDGHAMQGRMIARKLSHIDEWLASLDQTLVALTKEVRELASEQILLGNRVEGAFTRTMRANLRLDEIEDKDIKRV